MTVFENKISSDSSNLSSKFNFVTVLQYCKLWLWSSVASLPRYISPSAGNTCSLFEIFCLWWFAVFNILTFVLKDSFFLCDYHHFLAGIVQWFLSALSKKFLLSLIFFLFFLWISWILWSTRFCTECLVSHILSTNLSDILTCHYQKNKLSFLNQHFNGFNSLFLSWNKPKTQSFLIMVHSEHHLTFVFLSLWQSILPFLENKSNK